MNIRIDDNVDTAACQYMYDRSGVVWRMGARAGVCDERAFVAGFQFSEFIRRFMG